MKISCYVLAVISILVSRCTSEALESSAVLGVFFYEFYSDCAGIKFQKCDTILTVVFYLVYAIQAHKDII